MEPGRRHLPCLPGWAGLDYGYWLCRLGCSTTLGKMLSTKASLMIPMRVAQWAVTCIDSASRIGGGVKQRVCEWLKNGTRVGTTFECFTYNIADAQGYWFDHCTRGITCTVGHLGILDHPDKHHQQQQRRIYDRSPLALPFLSFTDDTTDEICFEADANGNTGYSVDIVVAVPKGMSPRVPQNPLHPYYRFYDRVNGWWMSPKTNEPNLEDNDPIVRLVNDAADV